MSGISTPEDQLSLSWMRRNMNFQPFSDTAALLVQRWEQTMEELLEQLEPNPNFIDTRSPFPPKRIPLNYANQVSKKWIDKLIMMHSDNGRKYHTLVHLEEMFGYIDILLFHTREFQTEIKSFETTAVALSVFFHDAVYDAKSSSNEKDSVALFQNFIEELISNHIDKQWEGSPLVEQFIMHTKTHSIDDTSIASDYLKAFLDADMSVLGKTPEAYDAYASLIRQEYMHVPHNVYCEKRAEMLESMLGIFKDGTGPKSVYFSEPMKKALGEQAVSNLLREIKSLRNYVIPNA